jgi:hypothetical protein
MNIDISRIQDGSMNGMRLWICHYNRPDLNKKALRNVPPTFVEVVDNDSHPTKGTVYYSHSHFRVIKSNKISSTAIKPFDNTGFRARTGEPVHVFLDKDECEEAWNEMLRSAIKRIMHEANEAKAKWSSQAAELTEKLCLD